MRPRRQKGTGSIYLAADGWVCAVRLASGLKLRRRAKNYPDAKAILAALIREHRTELAPDYRPTRKGSKRAGIKPTTRFAVLTRDNFRCVYCGATSLDARLVIDHAVSVLDGGSDDESNLVTACEECNLGKGSRTIVPIPHG